MNAVFHHSASITTKLLSLTGCHRRETRSQDQGAEQLETLFLTCFSSLLAVFSHVVEMGREEEGE